MICFLIERAHKSTQSGLSLLTSAPFISHTIKCASFWLFSHWIKSHKSLSILQIPRAKKPALDGRGQPLTYNCDVFCTSTPWPRRGEVLYSIKPKAHHHSTPHHQSLAYAFSRASYKIQLSDEINLSPS